MKGFDLESGTRVHAEMLVTADKKGWRRTGAFRLKLPWPVSALPTAWDGPAGAAAKLNKICKHPFPSIPIIFEAAHTALPDEPLPRHCRFCKRLPFDTAAEYNAAMEKWATLKADLSKEGKAKFAKLRSEHSSAHMHQHKFSTSSRYLASSSA
eukprot:3601304-Pleurochrysis_carterae.AAC.2